MVARTIIRLSVFGLILYGVSQCALKMAAPQVAQNQYDQYVAEKRQEGTLEDKVNALAQQVEAYPIKDPELKKCIIGELSIHRGPIFSGELTSPKDLERLDCYRWKIKDLTGLEEFQQLRELNLTSNPVTRLNPLAELKALESLNLSYTKVTDITPLTQLPHLRELKLKGVQLEQINHFANLSSLEKVDYTFGNKHRCADLDSLFRYLQYASISMRRPSQCIDRYGSEVGYQPTY